MKNILILGANGFLGRNLAIYYSKLGTNNKESLNVILADINYDQQEDINRNFEFEKLNIFDKNKLKEVLYNKDVIYNFIGYKGAMSSFYNYDKSLSVNCLGMLNLLDIIKDFEKKPLVVFPSSRLVYGKQNKNLISENDRLSPDSLYGIHKLTVEKYLDSYNKIFNIPYLIFRISLPYGSYYSNQIYKDNGIINLFTKSALNNEKIHIYGKGNQKRDIINIKDLVHIIYLSVHSNKLKNEVFNLGGIENYSIIDIAEMIAETLHTDIVKEKWDKDLKKIETGSVILKSDKLYKLINYKPKIKFKDFLKSL